MVLGDGTHLQMSICLHYLINMWSKILQSLNRSDPFCIPSRHEVVSMAHDRCQRAETDPCCETLSLSNEADMSSVSFTLIIDWWIVQGHPLHHSTHTVGTKFPSAIYLTPSVGLLLWVSIICNNQIYTDVDRTLLNEQSMLLFTATHEMRRLIRGFSYRSKGNLYGNNNYLFITTKREVNPKVIWKRILGPLSKSASRAILCTFCHIRGCYARDVRVHDKTPNLSLYVRRVFSCNRYTASCLLSFFNWQSINIDVFKIGDGSLYSCVVI